MNLLTLVALGAPSIGSPTSELNVFYETDPAGFKLTAQLLEADPTPFAVFADSAATDPVLVGISETGKDYVTLVSAEALASLPVAVELFAAHVTEGVLHLTPPAALKFGVDISCDLLDFDYAIGSDAGQVAGQLIGSQWAAAGLQISAKNGNASGSHPDQAILFDSSNPTGNDVDLQTPNPAGVGNTDPLGMLLIIAENAVDVAPSDGLYDDPDDEAKGGSLYFDFADGATMCSVTLVDIDETPGTQLRFYRNGDLVNPDETLDILSLGDGSVQKVVFNEENVERFEVFLRGSGGIGALELVPCPRVINFDETSLGIPRDLSTGEWITDQFDNIGVTISAQNNASGHPDKAILFDSENPTGGDFDLVTPNPAVAGNDTPLGKILILAENDVDISPADGLVDDPDDESAGGMITFVFSQPVRILSATVLDVDGTEFDALRFYDGLDAEISTIVIPDLPDGNVQQIQANVSGVRKLTFDLGGSGGITRVRFCPEASPE